MVTSFTLNMNEDVLFKHPCSMKSVPGILYFTTLRVTWIATSSSHTSRNILFPWTQIKDDKYSKSTDEKQRCMIRLLPMSGDPLVFNLTGSPVSRLRDELERAKLAVKRGRQGQSGSGDLNIAKKSTHAVSQSHPSTSQRTNTTSDSSHPSAHSRTEAQRRELLLSADSELRQLYAELVTGGVIDAEEFWSARSQLISEHEAKDTATHRGMSSSLLCDVQHAEVPTNGVRKFQLTPEAVMDIFQMYPHVLEEFTLLVPDQMTKDEFWVKYFQHEMFNKRAPSKNNLVVSSTNSKILSNTANVGVNGSGDGRKTNQQLPRHVSREMDLTQTYGDYHNAERLDPEDSKFRPTTVSEKYKRKGSLVMEQQEKEQKAFNNGSSTDSSEESTKRTRVDSNGERSWEKTENILNKEHMDDSFMPLQLVDRHALHTGASSDLLNPSPSMPQYGENEKKNDSTNHDNNKNNQHDRRDHMNLFPSSERAAAVLRREQDILDSFTDVARHASSLEGRGGSFQVGVVSGRQIASSTSDVSTGGAEGTTAGWFSMSSSSERQQESLEILSMNVNSLEHMQTTPELEQFIRDQFRHVSELLIHFYVTIAHSNKLNKASFQRLCDKNGRIQNKLEERLEIFQKKKNWVKENAATIFPVDGKHLLSYTFKYIKEICDLIYRAFEYWENYRQSTAMSL